MSAGKDHDGGEFACYNWFYDQGGWGLVINNMYIVIIFMLLLVFLLVQDY